MLLGYRLYPKYDSRSHAPKIGKEDRMEMCAPCSTCVVEQLKPWPYLPSALLGNRQKLSRTSCAFPKSFSNKILMHSYPTSGCAGNKSVKLPGSGQMWWLPECRKGRLCHLLNSRWNILVNVHAEYNLGLWLWLSFLHGISLKHSPDCTFFASFRHLQDSWNTYFYWKSTGTMCSTRVEPEAATKITSDNESECGEANSRAAILRSVVGWACCIGSLFRGGSNKMKCK